SLFRQDPARAALVRAVLTSLAVGFLFRLVPDISAGLAVLDVENLPGGFAYMYLVLTGLAVTFVLSGNSWTRSSRLALGLPISARTVWTVRMASLISIAVLSTAALAIATGITVDLHQGTVTFNSVILLTAARAAVTCVLILFLYQLPLTAQSSIPITAAYVVYMVFIGVMTLVFSAAALPSIAGTLVLLLVTIPLGTWLVIRVPPTFSVGPTVEESLTPVWTTPEEIEPIDAAGWEGQDGDSSKWTLRRVLFRGLKANFLIWFLLGIVGASVVVATLEFLKGTNAFMPLFFIVIYHLPLLQGALESMTPYDALPISRRVLWAHTVGPIAAMAALGLVIAWSIFMFNPKAFTQIHYSKCCVQVPWDYWEISRDGQIPTVTTSWGESFTPRAHPLWRGATIALYDPYASGPESSPRFVEYQMRRAAHAVYGDPLPEAISSRDYESPSNIVGGVESGAFTLDVTRGRISTDRNRTAAIALTVLVLLIAGMILPALLQYGPWVHRKIFKRASIGGLIVLVVIVVAVSIARLLGLTEVWYVGALISMGTRSLAHSLPLSTPILWFFCVTFWVGAYLLLERVFSTIEFPREKTMNRFAEVY
ncbi:MAG: hypothetical protein OQK55_00180, partial [Thermoanaerobaculales bacterium]|nr:hypothetical protein [Thermoanaerobaculales bacterium]